MAAFWSVLACPFLFGDAILAAAAAASRWPAQAMGVGVIALGMLAARGGMRTRDDSHEAQRANAAAIGRAPRQPPVRARARDSVW